MAKVSVIVPCFNHARFLDDSINGILGQHHADLELNIVDDCSTDNSWEIIQTWANRDSRVKALRHEKNGGLSRSRNDALRAATGEFIAFCDSDDVWEPEKLKTELSMLQDNPACGIIYSDASIIDDQGQPTGKRFSDLFPVPAPASGWLFSELAKRNFINIQSVVIRKECVERVGNFDENIEWVQDWWYWIQLSRHFQFLYCKSPLGRYRVHSGSTNLVHRRSYSVNRLKVFRRMLRNYGEIGTAEKAELVYGMGVDLCRIGKYRSGKRFFQAAMHLARHSPRMFGRFCKSLIRLCLCSVRAGSAAS